MNTDLVELFAVGVGERLDETELPLPTQTELEQTIREIWLAYDARQESDGQGMKLTDVDRTGSAG